MTDEEKDIVTKIAKKQASLYAVDVDLASIQANKVMLEDEKEELEKQLREAKEPKLRNGDYGINESDGSEFVLTLQSSQNKFFYSDGGGEIDALKHASDHVIYGNIFDDLKAMQENVEEKAEFEYQCETWSSHNLSLKMLDQQVSVRCTGSIHLSLPLLSKFNDKLRQMEATLKRKAVK